MWGEFRAFLLKTNALALAIGVVIGAALGSVVTSLVEDVIMPPIGLLLGGVDFAALQIVLKEAAGESPAVAIRYGEFLTAVMAFIVIAFVVFMISRSLIRPAVEDAGPAMKTCGFCRETVFADATRCRYCASEI